MKYVLLPMWVQVTSVYPNSTINTTNGQGPTQLGKDIDPYKLYIIVNDTTSNSYLHEEWTVHKCTGTEPTAWSVPPGCSPAPPQKYPAGLKWKMYPNVIHSNNYSNWFA